MESQTTSISLTMPCAAVCSLTVSAADSFLPAFPGAEGYGTKPIGGRGGKVIAVTTLNDSGPGSLRSAIESDGPRIVVFKVAGTIKANLSIKNDFITIAGRTAPGDGICIKGSIAVDASDVVIRHLRIRPDPEVETDAIWGRYKKNMILDHVSASWSSDEVMSLHHNEQVTLQWCMITEACAKGYSGHQFGGIRGNQSGAYHQNLIAKNDSRNPRWASGCGFNDNRNNVLYNRGYESSCGGETKQKEDRRKSPIPFSTINMAANYYKPGPGSRSEVRDRIVKPSSRDGMNDAGSCYVAVTHVVGSPEVTADNSSGVQGDTFRKLDTPWDAMTIQQQTPINACRVVLDHAGCSLPRRDLIDIRIIEDVRSGTATHGNNGIITIPDDVGGWPALKTGTTTEDSDNDGMPDEWERKHGLNPNSAGDSAHDKDGYTNIEECLTGTDPDEFLDYTRPENNVNTLK